MKTIHRYAAVVALAVTALSAQAGSLVRLSDINVRRVGDKLYVAMDIIPNDIRPGRDNEVVFTPMLTGVGTTDTLYLPSVRIAGRNRYYAHVRNKDVAPGDKVYYDRSREVISYRDEVPFQPWMMQSRLDMCQKLGNCCKPLRTDEATPLAELDFEPPRFIPDFRFVELTGDSAIELTAEGRAYIDFVVNRTEIKPTYRRNKTEIARIIESIDKVRNDPDATITRITIKGYASPEGPYDNNVRLAMGRTASLKEYVRRHYSFDPEIMSTDYEPEDWEGLREWLKTCTLPHRDEILRIAESDMAPDPRNSAIQTRYPREYKLILDSVYPGLRHSDYTVKYRIKAYATVEELLEVYKKTPERMRPVDFQRIAAVYPVGSPEYKEIMRTAVSIHPYDAKSNLNAATIAMQEGDLQGAARHLDRAGDIPEATYSRGVLAGMNGDLTRARSLFDAAAQSGYKPAADESARLQQLLDRDTARYLITPTGAGNGR